MGQKDHGCRPQTEAKTPIAWITILPAGAPLHQGVLNRTSCFSQEGRVPSLNPAQFLRN